MSRKILSKFLNDQSSQMPFLPLVGFFCSFDNSHRNIFAPRTSQKCLDIFWKTRSAVTDSGIKKMFSDSNITRHALANPLDVAPYFFAKGCKFIHKADASRQKRVAGVFGDFS